MSKHTKLNTDRILAFTAILISLLTLIIFVYQTNLVRQQSRLAVRPRIEFSQITNTDDSLVNVSLIVENRGLGPAIIENAAIVFNDQQYPLDFEDFFKQINFQDSLVEQTQNTTLSQGASILPGNHVTFYKVNFPLTHASHLQQNPLLMGPNGDTKFYVEVTYGSLYDEMWIQRSNHRGHPEEL